MSIRISEIAWSTQRHYWLVDARVPACLVADPASLGAPDIGMRCAPICWSRTANCSASSAGEADEGARVDLGGRQVWPTLIDIHTHLDKGHTVERNPNLDGTFHHARLAAIADRPYWTEDDLRRRMDFGLRCAYAHGVSAIRTHIDTYPETVERSWSVLCEMRDTWRGRVDLQAVSLCPVDLLQDDFGDRVASVVARGLPRWRMRAALVIMA